MSGRVIVSKVLEFSEHPWGANLLTTDGVQWSASVNITNSQDEALYTAVNTAAFNMVRWGDPGGAGVLKGAEVNMTFAINCDNATAIATYIVEGRNLANATGDETDWVNLVAATAIAAPMSIDFATNTLTYAGRLPIQTNLNKVPFEIRLKYKVNCNSELEVAQMRMRNSGVCNYMYQIAAG